MSNDKEPYSKKPANTAFKQQKLKAWEPILTPAPVIIAFIAIGVVFVIIGAFMISSTNKVIEHTIRYDDIPACRDNMGIDGKNKCDITINIPTPMKPPVYLYYRLDNFYQNHRRYVKSRNDDQLRGIVVTDFNKLKDCEPLITSDGENSSIDKILVPCGLIANSKFNDTFLMFTKNNTYINLRKKGIAWTSDVETKFKDYPANGTGIITFNKFSDEDFIVWMRTAALPDFKKLYRIYDGPEPLTDSVRVEITNYYPVQSFNGKKYVVLSTASWMGGKNPFLGYAYIIVGIICFVQGVVFLVKHYVSPRKMGDMKYLDWNANK
ncbi:hypothetical protein DICPUDRAFT_93631 [Dictyostelium purpureum]|uniref:ALA-interacting subunit n=1 Tax=Dictyostelium purpureum TaxID=5786 RepID=F0Z9X8_DICPU|nr:uncharacterized protein DICPUDRAFT_93631 [Dictyostelium purpureum]EGC39195.1 hypothetical protein DICPUDRAFT_93631 [Dictyostelium purpureum]|eukprot:XP_003284222.1 hypothetical protein DICPUDRAFT_93631 [Dictyostelium purpureum]